MFEKIVFFEKTKNNVDQKNILKVEIERIRPNPYQLRKNIQKMPLDDLCESIKQYGVLQPIQVRKLNFNSFELIAGERRLRAAELAGLKEIPALVIDENDNQASIMGLIENLQKENLSYFEEAEGYNNLLTSHGLTQEELAKKIGRSQSTIANKIRLLKLPMEIKKILEEKALTERHARALLKLTDQPLQLKVLRYVCEKNLNVKKTEEVIDRVIDKYSKLRNDKKIPKFTKAIKDIRIFVNTVKNAVEMMKKAGVNARAAQLDRGEYMEFIVRIPKEAH